MKGIDALLWDVDGTLAETERDGHRVAFNQAFEAFGLPWRWEDSEYGELLRVTGGRERLLHYMDSRPDAPPRVEERDTLARELHAKKNALYAELIDGAAIPLREGVRELMHECREHGVRMAIATTTSRANLEALLRAQLGSRWTEWFDAVVCGEDVQRKKPDPEVFVNVLAVLGVAPRQAVAIEDSPGGVAAARAAECPVVVTRSTYFANSPIEGATAVGPGLHSRAGWSPAPSESPSAAQGRVSLRDIAEWSARSAALPCIP